MQPLPLLRLDAFDAGASPEAFPRNSVRRIRVGRNSGPSRVLRPWPYGPSFCRYTQVRVGRKNRHFGRDAETQAMDGNKSVVQCLRQVR